MHSRSIDYWRHDHIYFGADHTRSERRTWIAIGLTAVMMVAEIVAGAAFGSMALLADGVHMATHAGALAIAALAYLYARRHARDVRFVFGTGKVGELAGFASAVFLAVVGILIAAESGLRLASPVIVRFDEAILVAVAGLVVNLVCAWLLHDGGHEHRRAAAHAHEDGHAHDHDHAHDHGHAHTHHAPAGSGHRDHNRRAAYFHVLADALTSVLAIVGLLFGRYYGWLWMDPLMGIVGGIIIARWSWGLIRGAGAVLLDVEPDRALSELIRSRLERNTDRISDLHLWRVGPGHLAAIVSIVSDRPRAPGDYKAQLDDLPLLSHVTIEVHRCEQPAGAA